jgi:hypothetical protein
MATADTRKLIADLLAGADEDTRKVVLEVFKIERDRLYQVTPYGVKDEIAAAIKDIVR